MKNAKGVTIWKRISREMKTFFPTIYQAKQVYSKLKYYPDHSESNNTRNNANTTRGTWYLKLMLLKHENIYPDIIVHSKLTYKVNAVEGHGTTI